MRNRAGIFSVMIIFFLCFGYSCKTLRDITETRKEFTIEDVQKKFKPNGGEFRSFSVTRMSIVLQENNKETGLRGNIRIIRDSATFVSLNAGLGIELVRAFLTNESIQVIDRINSEYDIMSYSQIRNLVGIDANYKFIENLLLNSFSFYDLVRLKEYDLYTDNEHIVINEKASSLIKGFDEAKIYFRKQDLIVTKIELFDNTTKHFASINYSLFGSFDKGITIPQEIKIFVNRGGETIDLVIKYLKAEINSIKDLNFVVPSRYL